MLCRSLPIVRYTSLIWLVLARKRPPPVAFAIRRSATGLKEELFSAIA